MTDLSYEFLSKFFQEHLPFCPTPSQVEAFRADLAVVSPYLMEAALIEVKVGTQGNLLVYRPNEWRAAIFGVYNRKVAEHAQLFPIFHSFETAFRSTVAVRLEDYYLSKRWWKPIADKMRKGIPPKEVKHIGHIGVTPIRPRAAYRIAKIIESIDEDFGIIQNGYEFMHLCTLNHIRQIVEEHWELFSRTFFPMSFKEFSAKFDRVKNARNNVYHHKPFSGMTDATNAAEILLDKLDFSLRFVFEKVSACAPSKPGFSIAVTSRHRTW